DALIKNYPSYLDHKPGFFLGWILYKLFRRIRFDESARDELKRLHREGTVVYAIKYPGRLDYLLYHYRFRTSRLPYPKIGFGLNMSLVLPLSGLWRVWKFSLGTLFKERRFPDPLKSGVYKEAIREGTPALICLLDPKGFARQFVHAEKDPLNFLLETQKGMDTPITVVPQLILYKMTPEKDKSSMLDILFGFRDNPGFIRKVVVFFRYNKRGFIVFGTPVNLKDYLESRPADRPVEAMATELRHTLIERIDRQKRVVLGPIMHSRQLIKERVLKDDKVRTTIERSAEGSKRRLRQLRKKAAGYFDEIAADYSQAYVEFFDVALTWLWNRIYQGVEVDNEGIAIVRQWAGRGPVIYIPSHKSHVDYLVLNHMLYKHNMHIPRTAAGKNLAFWPVGHFFRKVGAFFIRRTFKGALLYTAVFERYIQALLEEGYPLEFFIEGGRSRSGKLILPKIGFLSILLRAYEAGFCKDLIFVPTSIAYDRILEGQSYLKEVGGGEKKKESFKQMLGARRFLQRKYGKIYIRFGRPLSLKAYLEQSGETDQHPHKQLAFEIIKSINRVSLATPLAILAVAVLSKHRRGFELGELMDTVETIMAFLKDRGAPTAASLDHLDSSMTETLAMLIQSKMVRQLEDVDNTETFYYVEDDQKPELAYYKNNIIHYFVSHGYAAISLLSGNEAAKSVEGIKEDFRFLKALLEKEFVYEDRDFSESELNATLDYFEKASLLKRTAEQSKIEVTRLGYDKLPIWAALVKTFLESYWVTTRVLLQREKEGSAKGNALKQIDYQAQRFLKLGLIDHREAISKVNFTNSLGYFDEKMLDQDKAPDEKSDNPLENL
ncbi:MAG: 1-acyl-sn-glycerol-3-phosphate acyltransferase, partial [Deltaproteobacteria bacterium]|nr:1-acyl-sn-glycerol-3-phosphate acyltransferase [Deltaproteobacteria bacterium]